MSFPAPFYARGDHLAIDLPGASALFTTRRGGYSVGAYASLNLGRSTQDDPAAVGRNRRMIEAQLGLRFVSGAQVHGAEVRRVSGVPERDGALVQADGQATAQGGLAPMVLVADCLPIAIAARGAVAMLHAGWRGIAAGIVAQGVRAVRELGALGPMAAAIGPGAGPCCYEVGEEVQAVFARAGHEARGSTLDLKAIAGTALARAGVGDVHDVGLCTICAEESLFYSHRRQHGVTGRQAGIAWLS